LVIRSRNGCAYTAAPLKALAVFLCPQFGLSLSPQVSAMTIDAATLVPFSSGCTQLGIPLPTAERYLRKHPHCLPPIHRVGWGRFFARQDLDRYRAARALVTSRLQTLDAGLAWMQPSLSRRG
jgi:hypothetical protein